MSERELLYLCTPGSGDLLTSRIRDAGWVVTEAHAASQAREIIDRGNIHVGLTLLDESSRAQNELLDLWPLGERVQWVAMLDNGALQSSRVSRLIAKYFYDYHTLPADLDRLLFSLGHAWGMASMACAIQSTENLRSPPVLSKARQQTLDQARGHAEKSAILASLKRARRNISRAARDLGVSRVTLYRLLEKHAITVF